MRILWSLEKVSVTIEVNITGIHVMSLWYTHIAIIKFQKKIYDDIYV